MTEPRTIYRYGWMAWLWRLLIVAAQGAGWFLVFIGFVNAEFWAYLVAAPLILPGGSLGMSWRRKWTCSTMATWW